ncbi:MAG: peptide chain release factor N(5)-glutamine methyltransferase [candidate division WOR-3 bacterium]
MNLTYRDLLKQAQRDFANLQDAEYVIQALSNKPRYELFMSQQFVDPAIINRYHTLLNRYQPDMPIPYLVNKAYFLDYELYVDPRVMIPRFETEELVMRTARKVKHPKIIIDIGTGSGVIANALAHLFPQAKIIATDISSDALDVAQRNIAKYRLGHQITLTCCDVLPKCDDLKSAVDLIISNPPYIPEDEIEKLAPRVKNYEPLVALNGGKNGMEIISRIIENAVDFLCPDGLLALEIDPRQVKLIKRMKLSVAFEKDNQGMFRYAFIRNQPLENSH